MSEGRGGGRGVRAVGARPRRGGGGDGGRLRRRRRRRGAGRRAAAALAPPLPGPHARRAARVRKRGGAAAHVASIWTIAFFTSVLVRTSSLLEALYTTSRMRVLRVQTSEPHEKLPVSARSARCLIEPPRTRTSRIRFAPILVIAIWRPISCFRFMWCVGFLPPVRRRLCWESRVIPMAHRGRARGINGDLRIEEEGGGELVREGESGERRRRARRSSRNSLAHAAREGGGRIGQGVMGRGYPVYGRVRGREGRAAAGTWYAPEAKVVK